MTAISRFNSISSQRTRLPNLPWPWPPGGEKTSDWLRAVAVLEKHWQLSTFFALAVLLTVFCVTYLTQPVYEATARIEVDPAGEVFSLEGNAASSDAEYLETQAQILQSDAFGVEVIRKLHLDQNPEMVGKIKPSDSAVATPGAQYRRTTTYLAREVGAR